MLLSSRSQSTRRGAVAPYVAVSMPMLVAIVALAVDCGLMFDKRRHAQGSCDAAALAAGGDLFLTYTNSFLFDDGKDLAGVARASALAIAAANGYTNNGTDSVVTVNIPPTSGPFTGQLGCVEVIIEYKLRRGFSAIFGSGNLPIRVRSVARGRWAPFGIGILCLDPLSRGSLSVQGQAHGEVPNAAVIVNSIDQFAADGGGQGGTISAKSFEITGGYNQSGGEQFIGPIRTGVPPTPDPFRDLPEPNKASMPVYRQSDATVENLGGGLKRFTFQPGLYRGGLSFSGQDIVVMNPGIYYMEGGGFHFSGTSSTSLTATNVMLFNGPAANGSMGDISITGNGSVTWTPPSTGVYKGLSFFQARNQDETIAINGNGSMNIKGAYYARDALITIGGNGLNYVGSQFVSWNLTMHGSGTYIVPWDAGNIQPVREMRLVE